MKKAIDLHKEWAKDPKFRKEYRALQDEFDLASTLIAARTHAGLSQRELAVRMKTSQSFVARLEGGAVTPTWETLNRYARATGTRLRIALEHEDSESFLASQKGLETIARGKRSATAGGPAK